MNLEGLTAVIIGGTSGIGKAIALGLARAGADVVATSRSTEAVEMTAGELEEIGVRTLRIFQRCLKSSFALGFAGSRAGGVWRSRRSRQLGRDDEARAYPGTR